MSTITRCEFEHYFIDMPFVWIGPLPNHVFSRKRRRHVYRNKWRRYDAECERRIEQARKERQ